MKKFLAVCFLLPMIGYGQKFSIVEQPKEKKIDVYYGKKLITSYIYYDSLFKTALYPITTLNGTTITREFPYKLKVGERADHPHHVGLFFAHESVNGHDFWNMSTDIAPEKRKNYGKEVFSGAMVSNKGATFITDVVWKTFDNEDYLQEQTTFEFSASKNDLIIERSTRLTAMTDVVIKDKKDALMGLRVARELELPVEGEDLFVTLPHGYVAKMPNDITKVTGNYKNSESIIGADVWGKKATWVCLDGKINGKDISIAIIDHPSNIDYPSYWHARGYGLFAVNPLGKEVFTEGKAKIDLTLKKGESATFRYRVVVREGSKLTPAELNQHVKSFSEIK